MNRLALPSLILALGFLPAHAAEEFTVEPTLFEATVQLDGTLLPGTSHPLQFTPESWTSLKILEVKEQGAAVKKGEAVVTLDLEAIDRKIADDKTAAELRALALANAERELANLKISTDWKLEVAKRTYERTKEDLAYFKKVGRPLSEEGVTRSVDRAQRSLENQQEELTQLLKMYEEDDLTEETEEIILKRQRDAVADSEFMLKRTELSAKQTLEVELPRQATDLEQGFKDAELTWNSHQELLPRALEQKSLEVEKLRVENERAAKTEAEVVADREVMTQVAPVAGRVYYGEIADGKWNPGEAPKFMKEGGTVPPDTTYATVVEDSAPLEFHAFADEAVMMKLAEAKEGHLAPAATPRRHLPVTVESVDRYPGIDGKYHVVLTLNELPDGLALVAGMKGKATLVTTRHEKALTIPTGAMKEEPGGRFTVQVKLADGASESRTVTPGVEADGKIQILEGLEPGQVILVEGKSE